MRGHIVVYQGARTSGSWVKWPPLTQQLNGITSLPENAGVLLRDAAYSSATSCIVSINVKFFRKCISQPPSSSTVFLTKSGLSVQEKLANVHTLALAHTAFRDKGVNVDNKTGVLSNTSVSNL
jgi:hypothetical protein